MNFPEQNIAHIKIRRLIQPEIVIRAAILFVCMFNALLFQLPFYGDHVTLISEPAHFFYDFKFSALYLPNSMATGHPVLYPMFTALCWLLFGKALWVSHALTLCCSLFLLIQWHQFVKSRLPAVYQSVALLLFLFNPVMLAQEANMSIDILLTGLLFWGINSIDNKRFGRLAAVIVILSLVSLRGFMLIALLFSYQVFTQGGVLKSVLTSVRIYALAIVPVTAYFIGQYIHSGWWLLPPDSNWSGSRHLVSGIGFLGKGFELGLRYFEFGMAIPAVVVVGMLFYRKSKHPKMPSRVLIVCGMAIFALFLLPFSSPILIRYLIPLQLLTMFYFTADLSTWKTRWLRRLALYGTLILMVAQHFFAYPQMSRSIFDYNWGDGSLAHLSYFKFRAEAEQYLEEKGIPADSVFTAFPNYKPFELTNLSNSKVAYRNLADTIGVNGGYVLYCNNMNTIPKLTSEQFERNYELLRTWQAYPIVYKLYERKAISSN